MSDKKLWEQYVALEKERDALRSLVVMRFDHDHPPQFTQGYDTHELTEPVTAEHCRWFVAEIERLSAEVAHIKEVEFPRKAQAVADGWRGKCERLEAKIAEMEQQVPLDAGSDVFRSAFEAALKAGNWPATRQGDGYRSPSTQIAWRIAFSTVNRLKLYALPGAQGEEK